MSDLKVCRICLSKGVKVYNYNRYYLKQYYEQVMGKNINENDGLPQHFCYVCAAMLYKFHKFKEKCWTGEKVLNKMLWSGPITFTSISQIDRTDNNLKSPIDIITVSKRVKTCIVKSKSLFNSQIKKNKEIKIPEIKIPEIEKCIVVYDSDDSLDSKNLADIKNEIIHKEVENLEDKDTNVNIDKIFVEEHNIPNFKDKILFTENIDIDDDRVLSEDEDLNPERLNDVVKTSNFKQDLSDEITIVEENICPQDQVNKVKDDENTFITNLTEKKRKKSRVNKNVKKKAKKFEDFGPKYNSLNPKHWLKISLSEEEAIEEFKARAQDKKYVSAAYQCTDCIKGFSKEDILSRHIKLRHHESLGPLECRFCKMRFKWKCYLSRHITRHYAKYKCLRCDIMCPLETTALLHNEYHNGVIRKCVHCGDEFRHSSTYYSHLRTHRSEHVCTLCGISFVSVMGLHMHKKIKHVDLDMQQLNTGKDSEEDVNTYCEKCDIKFETQKAYKEHVFQSAKHTEGIEDLELEDPVHSKPQRRRKGSRRNPHKLTTCTICNKNFSSHSSYLKHHNAEHKDEPLPSKNLERQICEICGISLLSTSIPSHLNTHTREILFRCPTCHMPFNSKSSMKRHQVVHTGEKPFGCTLCEKRFTQKSSMKLHYRTFHLKEPYPKRNRRKNLGIQKEVEDFSINEEDSEESLKVDKWR